MASIDEIFRKRKLDSPSGAAGLANKSAKLANGSSPHFSSSSHSSRHRAVSVKEERDEELKQEEDEEDDVEAGPSLPPDGDEEENEDGDEGDDTEGRFFESGINAREESALKLLERVEASVAASGAGAEAEAEGEGEADESKIDLAWLKRTALNLERKINKNAELRAKFENEPLKFISSEADLDAEIRNLSLLATTATATATATSTADQQQQQQNLYADFVRSGCVDSLVGLLAHENSDIAVSVCQVLSELTDDDVVVNTAQRKVLADALVKADVVDLLVSNLGRFERDISSNGQSGNGSDGDGDGVYYVLSTIENFLSEPSIHEIVGSHTGLQQWLVKRITHTPQPGQTTKVDQNRLYAAEILAILVLNPQSRHRHTLAKNTDIVDTVLQLLAPYRGTTQRDEDDSDDEDDDSDADSDSDEQVEFVENLFDILTCLVEDDLAAGQFIDSEGIELCLLMVRVGTQSQSKNKHKKRKKNKKKRKNRARIRDMIQPRALQVLDHAMSPTPGGGGGGGGASTRTSKTARSPATTVRMCTYFVESAAGLGALFGLFMRLTTTTTTSSSTSTVKHQDRDENDNTAAAIVEHILGILASMLAHTPANSAARIRTLAKFVVDDSSSEQAKDESKSKNKNKNKNKIDRLLGLRATYHKTIQDHQHKRHPNEDLDEDDDESQDQIQQAQFILNTIDRILAWLAAEDGQARARIARSPCLAVNLEQKQTQTQTQDGHANANANANANGLAVLRKSLQDQLDVLADDDDDDDHHHQSQSQNRARKHNQNGDDNDTDNGNEQDINNNTYDPRDILRALIDCL